MGLVVFDDLAFFLIDVKVKLKKKMKWSSSENCEKSKQQFVEAQDFDASWKVWSI